MTTPTHNSKLPWQRPGTNGFHNECGEYMCTGAKMGRPDYIPHSPEAVTKLRLRKVPLIDYCYDAGGAYWGMPADLWCAWGESETDQGTTDGAEMFFRADSRETAKRIANNTFPNAKFFN